MRARRFHEGLDDRNSQKQSDSMAHKLIYFISVLTHIGPPTPDAAAFPSSSKYRNGTIEWKSL